MENLIKAWKENWLPWCKVSQEMKAVAETIKATNFKYWSVTSSYKMNASGTGPKGGFADGDIYSLPEDFQCPHGETKEVVTGRDYTRSPGRDIVSKFCLWCGEEVPDKPKMGWGRYGVKTDAKEYWFDGPTGEEALDLAIRMVGFGGVKYRYPCGDETGFIMTAPDSDDELGPCTPVAVRFWEVMK